MRKAAHVSAAHFHTPQCLAHARAYASPGTYTHTRIISTHKHDRDVARQAHGTHIRDCRAHLSEEVSGQIANKLEPAACKRIAHVLEKREAEAPLSREVVLDEMP